MPKCQVCQLREATITLKGKVVYHYSWVVFDAIWHVCQQCFDVRFVDKIGDLNDNLEVLPEGSSQEASKLQAELESEKEKVKNLADCIKDPNFGSQYRYAGHSKEQMDELTTLKKELEQARHRVEVLEAQCKWAGSRIDEKDKQIKELKQKHLEDLAKIRRHMAETGDIMCFEVDKWITKMKEAERK